MVELTSLNARVYSRLGQRGAIFGMTLLEIAENRPDIMVLSADLITLSGLERFVTTYPDKFLNVGIAEQNMIGIAAGLANEGYKAIATTYATFITLRSCEQVRHFLGYMKSNVIIVGSGAGMVMTFSGNTHYSIEDIAVMRAIPNITILSPSDAGLAAKSFEAAIELNRPVYIRLTGALNCPVIYKNDFKYEIGKSIVLREGSDVTVFATGMMVALSLKAAELLETTNLSVKVVDMHTVKPFDTKVVEESLSSKLFVSVEEHNIIGGLGGAISEFLTSKGNTAPLLRLGIHDTFCKVGDYDYLLMQNRLTPELITEDILGKYQSISK